MIRVLHVDDCREDRQLTGIRLRKLAADLEIRGTSSAAEALDILHRDEVDCVLSDYKMPERDGLELLQQLRGEGVDVPFIFLTGQGNEKVAAEALRAGADDYFTKQEGFAHYDRLLNSIRLLSRSHEERLKRKEAEDALRESEKRLRRIVEQMPYPVEVCDPEGTAVLVNSAFLEMFGIPSADLVVGRFNVFSDPLTDTLGIRSAVERVYQGETLQLPELELPMALVGDHYQASKSGNVHQEVTMFPVLSKSNEVTHVVTIWKDITDRKEMEKNLQASRERFEHLAENALDFIFHIEVGDSPRFLYASPSAREVLGLEPERLYQNPRLILEMIHQDDRDKCLMLLTNPPAKVTTETCRVERGDGRVALVEAVLKPVLDERGNVVALQGIARDISSRAQAAERYASSSDFFRAIFDLSPDAMLIHGRGKIELVNESAVRLLGAASASELIGMEVLKFAHPDIRKSVERRIEEAHRSKKSPGLRQERLVRLDGGIVEVEANGAPIFYRGEPATLVVFRDISERLRSGVELEDRARALEALNSELESFTYSVSHDLKAPLRQSEGFGRMLAEQYGDALDGEGQELIAGLLAANERMKRIIDDLLRLSHLMQSNIRPKEVNVSALAGGILSALQEAHPHRRVEARIKGNVKVRGDARLLELALENIINNAWKFTSRRDEAVIELGVTETGGKKTIFIRDNGVGFDMSRSKRLFVPFQRLHSEREFEGSGIGLAIVKRIVHRHGGRVWAESKPGEGATFYFQLP